MSCTLYIALLALRAFSGRSEHVDGFLGAPGAADRPRPGRGHDPERPAAVRALALQDPVTRWAHVHACF